MSIDLSRLSETELVELNRRIVERLQLIRAGRDLSQLARLSVGMVVEFTADDGRLIRGAISRLNRQTATVVTTSGPLPVSASRLRIPPDPGAPPPLPHFGSAGSRRPAD